MPKISPENNKQDVAIGKISTRLKGLEKRFDTFLSNEFAHLRSVVFWILGTVVIGFLITITTILISKFI